MKNHYYILCSLVLLCACGPSNESTGFLMAEGDMDNGASIDMNGNPISSASTSKTTIQGISYRMDMMSALYYLNVKGEKVIEKDQEGLKKESVLIFEFLSVEDGADLFESDRIQMDKEDAIKYLVGDIANDFVLMQGDKEFTANGVQYDGAMTSPNKFRLFLFYKDLKASEPIRLKYYDRLFGAGMINLKQEEITQL